MLVEKKHIKQDNKEIVILNVDGNVKLGHSPEFFISALDNVYRYNRNIIVDFRSIDYVDSTGIGELVGVCCSFIRSGKKLVFVANMERIFRYFSLAKINALIFVNELDALASFNHNPNESPAP